MTLRPARIVRHALAALLVVALIGPTAEAQQQPPQQQAGERRHVPSPMTILNNALKGMRERAARRQAAASRTGEARAAASRTGEARAAASRTGEARPASRRTGEARPAPRRRGVQTRSTESVVARLPKPRPTPASTLDGTAALTDLAARLDPGSVPAASDERPGQAETPPADLVKMPTSFASAGMAAPRATLEIPEDVLPRLGKLEEDSADAQLTLQAPVLAGPVEEAATALAASALIARVPRAKPPHSAMLAMVDPKSSEPPPTAPAPVELSADEAACLARLPSLGVEFTKLDEIQHPGACDVAAPMKVSSLGMGVALTPEAILNCRTTEALALWVRNSMVPAARTLLQATPNKIVHGSTYVCRPRNNQDGARLSEHATANAVDIVSVGFSDRPPIDIEALSPASPEGKFSAAIRRESCAYFTTVLGPGSNAAHATHFHFDMAQRRGGHRLCELGGTSTAERAR